MRPFRSLTLPAKLIVLSYGLLAAVGVYVGLFNMPVVTGCAFYGQCRDSGDPKAAGDAAEELP